MKFQQVLGLRIVCLFVHISILISGAAQAHYGDSTSKVLPPLCGTLFNVEPETYKIMRKYAPRATSWVISKAIAAKFRTYADPKIIGDQSTKVLNEILSLSDGPNPYIDRIGLFNEIEKNIERNIVVRIRLENYLLKFVEKGLLEIDDSWQFKIWEKLSADAAKLKMPKKLLFTLEKSTFRLADEVLSLSTSSIYLLRNQALLLREFFRDSSRVSSNALVLIFDRISFADQMNIISHAKLSEINIDSVKLSAFLKDYAKGRESFKDTLGELSWSTHSASLVSRDLKLSYPMLENRIGENLFRAYVSTLAVLMTNSVTPRFEQPLVSLTEISPNSLNAFERAGDAVAFMAVILRQFAELQNQLNYGNQRQKATAQKKYDTFVQIYSTIIWTVYRSPNFNGIRSFYRAYSPLMARYFNSYDLTIPNSSDENYVFTSSNSNLDEKSDPKKIEEFVSGPFTFLKKSQWTRNFELRPIDKLK